LGGAGQTWEADETFIGRQEGQPKTQRGAPRRFRLTNMGLFLGGHPAIAAAARDRGLDHRFALRRKRGVDRVDTTAPQRPLRLGASPFQS
jgi:hypothetical protein